MLTPHTLTLIAVLCGLASVAPTLVNESPAAPEARATVGLEAVLAGVERAISEGDAKGVSRYFGNEVELNCGGGEGVYSRRQAEFMLRSFFRAHPPKSYTTQSRDGQEKIVGSYVANDGKTYRVEARLTLAGNRTVVGYLYFVAS